jgi:hypothetical protein
MAQNKYVIVDNYDELTALEERQPELKQVPLILLSDSFNLEQLAFFAERGFQYFDDAISDEQARKMAEAIHDIMWNWFRDKQGKDLSLINGLSLGITFSSSMEILLNSIIKYEVALANILKKGDELYYVSCTDDVFLAVISELKRKIGLSVKVIELAAEQKVVLHGKQKLKLDPGARKRDLGPYFKIDRRAGFIYGLLRIIRKSSPNDVQKQRVLLYSAGKLDEFISSKTRESGWVLSFSSLKDLLLMIARKISPGSRYYFAASSNDLNEETKGVLAALEANLGKVRSVDHIALLAMMRKYIFKYAGGVVSFYANTLKDMTALTPDLVIISTDVIEPHLIVAQAAKKAGIKTALLPHGIDDWGYKELRTGGSKVIEHCLAYGNKHVLDNLGHGVDRDRIVVTSFPYFSRFLPVREKQTGHYRKALILTPDYCNLSPASKSGYFFRYMNEAVRMLKSLNIEIIGVKSRGDYDHLYHDINGGFIIVENEKVRWLTGYTSFPEVAAEADLVIGNSSTALIEAGLLGIDYYVICPELELFPVSISRNVDKLMHVARSFGELRANIMERKVYRDGYSVKDYVDLLNVEAKEDLYRKFEENVLSVARTI